MRGILGPAILTVAGGFGLTHTGAAFDLYEAAYPADPAKRLAIEYCVTADPTFNRLNPDDRARCYGGLLVPAMPTSLRPIAAARFDPGPEHAPRDDLRRQQATDRYLNRSARP